MVEKVLREIPKGFICSLCDKCEHNPQTTEIKFSEATIELTETTKERLKLITNKIGMPEPCVACFMIRNFFKNHPDHLTRDLYELFMREAKK